MAWQKQGKFSKGKKVHEKTSIDSTSDSMGRRSQSDTGQDQDFEGADQKDSKANQLHWGRFLSAWESCRDRHPGQQAVLNAVFEEKCQYVFYRAGRKGAKTTTGIDVAWRLANEAPNRVGYLCYPTIAQGIEVVWEERRVQTCDRKDDKMFDQFVEKVDDSRHIVRFSNGSFIKLIGTWTEARGRGTQPDFIVFDEVQDCNPDYIEAMDANLAAKPHAQCVMMGTPPKKRNHYEDWYSRVESNPRGKVFHFTSYDNIRLPHLKEWLDNKKIELIKAGKEDVWLREYMAELCYSSSDRILPDPKFEEYDDLEKFLRYFAYEDRIPIMAVSVHPTYFCAMVAVLVPKKTILVLDHMIFPQVWNQSFADMYPQLGEKAKLVQDLCHKRIRNLVWDESGSFADIITGFTKCRRDIKWQDRGIPILRELMVKEKIRFSREVADFGLECQNLLIEENEKDVQKNYPHICTLAMMVNEYFSQDKISIPHLKPFDKYEAFREMGIPCPPTKKGKTLFTFNK
jgi:hypothetical protein